MRLRYVIVILMMVGLIDYWVPFILLKDIAHFYASYLLWCVPTLAVIGFAAGYTRNWPNTKEL